MITNNMATPNEADLRIDFFNGARIKLYGSDNPDSIRWVFFHGVVFDEYSQQPVNVWTEIVRPAISDYKWWVIWIGTPKGRNSFYELYKKAIKDPLWFWYLLKASESGIIDPEELQDAKDNMSEDEYNQEFEASFEAAIRWAYYTKELSIIRESWRITKNVFDKNLRVFTFWDLGISDYTSIIFGQFYNGTARIIDYYTANWYDLAHYANMLRDKNKTLWYNFAEHWLPHDAKVRDLSSGMSREDLLLGMGLRIKITPNIWIKDWIEAARVMTKSLWFDESTTKELIDSLWQYTQEWDMSKGMFKDKPKHDKHSHAADAFRYMGVLYKIMTQDIEQWQVLTQSFDL